MTVASTPQAREYSQVDITSHAFWSRPFDQRDETFARLRAGRGTQLASADVQPVRSAGTRLLGTDPARGHRLRQSAPRAVHLGAGCRAGPDARRVPAHRHVLPDDGSAASTPSTAG